MKKSIVLYLLILLGGCKEISFKEAQPKDKNSLKEIPYILRGRYLLVDENGSTKDTLTVSQSGYHTGVKQTDEGLLSDSLVLKYYKGYYFLSLNEKPEWLLRVIKREKNGDLTFMAMDSDDRDFNHLINKLSNEIKIDSLVVSGEKLYQIDPKPKKLISLIKKGFFRKTVLKKIK